MKFQIIEVIESILYTKRVCFLLFLLPALLSVAQANEHKMVTPWVKAIMMPDEFLRYATVLTAEQQAEWDRIRELIRPWLWSSRVQLEPHTVGAPEQKGLQHLISRRVEATMQPELFPPAACELTMFYREKTDTTQQLHAMRFFVSYKINGYRVAIKGGITNMNVDSLRIFIGRENEYPVAKEVFIVTPATLTQETIKVREGATTEERLQAKTIELKGLAAEFR